MKSNCTNCNCNTALFKMQTEMWNILTYLQKIVGIFGNWTKLLKRNLSFPTVWPDGSVSFRSWLPLNLLNVLIREGCKKIQKKIWSFLTLGVVGCSSPTNESSCQVGLGKEVPFHKGIWNLHAIKKRSWQNENNDYFSDHISIGRGFIATGPR